MFRLLNFKQILNKPSNFLKFNLFRHGTTTMPESKTFLTHPLLKTTEFEQNLSPEEKKTMKRFIIHRYDPEQSETDKHYMSYHVDLKDCGPMVLDALIKIKDEIDPTLSFRR
jgi:hypothetical protein